MKVLYLCTGNSARSQMAEAFTRSLVPEGAGIDIFSAGTEPEGIHPETVAVMKEVGLDLSAGRSKGLDEVPLDSMDLVVTLCDDARTRCPTLPESCNRIHWGLTDPAAATGTPEEVREAFRAVRAQVLSCVKALLFELATTAGRKSDG